MRESVPTFALVIGLLSLPAAATPIIDNNHIYCWGDPFGDQFDNYAEVQPGDTIMLQIWVNDLDGSVDLTTDMTLVNENWTHAANGAWTSVWWNPAVIDAPLVHEDRTDTYYASYWNATGYISFGSDHWAKHYDNWTGDGVRWVAEDHLLINLSFTIQETAPLGLSRIGLEQAFSWYQTLFYRDRIEADGSDPYAMTLNVVPEPATMSLLALGGPALLRKRR